MSVREDSGRSPAGARARAVAERRELEDRTVDTFHGLRRMLEAVVDDVLAADHTGDDARDDVDVRAWAALVTFATLAPVCLILDDDPDSMMWKRLRRRVEPGPRPFPEHVAGQRKGLDRLLSPMLQLLGARMAARSGTETALELMWTPVDLISAAVDDLVVVGRALGHQEAELRGAAHTGELSSIGIAAAESLSETFATFGMDE